VNDSDFPSDSSLWERWLFGGWYHRAWCWWSCHHDFQDPYGWHQEGHKPIQHPICTTC
jgi:hypothetical protein